MIFDSSLSTLIRSHRWGSDQTPPTPEWLEATFHQHPQPLGRLLKYKKYVFPHLVGLEDDFFKGKHHLRFRRGLPWFQGECTAKSLGFSVNSANPRTPNIAQSFGGRGSSNAEPHSSWLQSPSMGIMIHWKISSYHHVYLPKAVLKKKDSHFTTSIWFFQEVPPTGEILKIFGKLPSKSSSFRAVEWQTSTSPWLSKPNANCSVLLFQPLSVRKSHHSVHYKKWSSENPPKILVKFGALPPGATGKTPPQTAATRIVAVER